MAHGRENNSKGRGVHQNIRWSSPLSPQHAVRRDASFRETIHHVASVSKQSCKQYGESTDWQTNERNPGKQNAERVRGRRHARFPAHLVCTLALRFLVANLKVLCPLDWSQADGLAVRACQSQRNLLGGLRLLVEDRLCLPAKASLLAVVPPLALCNERGLASLVLGHLERLVVAALGRLAEGPQGLGGVHHSPC